MNRFCASLFTHSHFLLQAVPHRRPPVKCALQYAVASSRGQAIGGIGNDIWDPAHNRLFLFPSHLVCLFHCPDSAVHPRLTKVRTDQMSKALIAINNITMHISLHTQHRLIWPLALGCTRLTLRRIRLQSSCVSTCLSSVR